MRVLVTGSHGFIGKNLVEALKARGDEVFEVDTKIGRDVIDIALPRNVEEVYHLACVTQVQAEKDPARSRFVNAYSALAVADHAADVGARFIYTSTASVYGNAEEIPTPSVAPTNPETTYARDKLKGETFVKNSKLEGDYTIFRLSNVYGPHQTLENPYCGVVGRFIEQATKGEKMTIIGDGNQTRDFTYVEDVVKHLMNPDLKGLFNCSHGEEIDILELAMIVDEFIPSVHLWPFKTVEPRSVDTIQRRCLISDLECPTTLREGVAKTLEWRNGLV